MAMMGSITRTHTSESVTQRENGKNEKQEKKKIFDKRFYDKTYILINMIAVNFSKW